MTRRCISRSWRMSVLQAFCRLPDLPSSPRESRQPGQSPCLAELRKDRFSCFGILVLKPVGTSRASLQSQPPSPSLLIASMTPRQEPSKSTIGIARRLRVTYLHASCGRSWNGRRIESGFRQNFLHSRHPVAASSEIARSQKVDVHTMDSQSSKRLVEAGIAVAVLRGFHEFRGRSQRFPVRQRHCDVH